MDTFLVGEAGYSSGFKIRPMRAFVGIDALRTHLEAASGFPSKNRVLSYTTRVYQVFPDKQPKKLNEAKLLSMLGEVAPTSARGRQKLPKAASYMKGTVLSYYQLQQLKDGAVVWAVYRNPESGEMLINAPHVIRRSHAESTAKVPAWKLVDLKDKSGEELFIQDPGSRTPGAGAIDADRMVLYTAVTVR